MIADIIQKIRDVIDDNLRTDGVYTDVYYNSLIFTLPDSNAVSSSIVVYKNGAEWADTNYSYDSTTGKLTVTGTLAVGDSLQVTYSYYKNYSDTELRGKIRAAALYLSIERYKTFVIKETEEPLPTPTEEEENLLALVASILIKPAITSYRTPEVSISFPNRKSSEDKIKEAIRQLRRAYGYLGYIDPTEKINFEDN